MLASGSSIHHHTKSLKCPTLKIIEYSCGVHGGISGLLETCDNCIVVYISLYSCLLPDWQDCESLLFRPSKCTCSPDFCNVILPIPLLSLLSSSPHPSSTPHLSPPISSSLPSHLTLPSLPPYPPSPPTLPSSLPPHSPSPSLSLLSATNIYPPTCVFQYAIDDSLPFILNILLAQLYGLLGTIAVTCYGLPWFTLLLVPLGVLYYHIQKYYRRTSRYVRAWK